jgi:DNA polymerase III subunit epsilon
MREVVFDTETTGLDPAQGHRVVEIGCIELLNGIPTGDTFHRYLNPERDIPAEAFEVHGLSAEFLKDKPLFAAVADELLAFLGEDPLVAHSAMFDLGFLNAELERLSRPALARDRMIDTLMLARRKYPGSSNRLDDLCARYKISNAHRTKHGALLDAELLAEVYVELTGTRQAVLGLAETAANVVDARALSSARRERPQPLSPRVTAADHALHREFVATLGPKALWRDYLSAPPATDSSS